MSRVKRAGPPPVGLCRIVCTFVAGMVSPARSGLAGPASTMSRPILPISLSLALAISACASSGTYRNGVFEGPLVVYRVDAPSDGWHFVHFSGNDLAWGGPSGEVIAINSECEDHGDPSLAVLTNHLLIGFEDRVVRERESLRISDRGALRTRLSASLDGVPVEMELTVLKKDGCVYDLTYLAPPERFDEHLPTYRKVVASFQAPGRR